MIDWARFGQWAAVIGYAVFFGWMTRNAIRREIEREAAGEDLYV
jgi:hypothetical protein